MRAGWTVDFGEIPRFPVQERNLIQRDDLEPVRIILGKDFDGLVARIETLEQRLEEEQQERKRLEDMVLAMWDAPGMPGAQAEAEEFHSAKNE